jgi:hypothetical protein
MTTFPSFSLRASLCESVSWLPWSLASAYKPKSRPQLRPVPSEFSCGQPRVGQPLAAHRSDETIQPFQRVILDVAFVQPPCKFVGISSKVLRADVVKGSVHSPLENSPHAFNAVRACRASRVLASRMIHGLMLEKQPIKIVKNKVIVGIELRTDFNLIVNLFRDVLQSPALGNTSAS